MRKWWLLAGLLGIVLVGCRAPAGTVPPRSGATEGPEPALRGTGTPTREAGTLPPCRVLTPVTPTPHQATYLLEGDHRLGPLDAPLVIVTYGDYQCEPCARLDAAMWRLLEAYPETVLWVYRHFPLVPLNDKALMAVQAAEAAARQNRFWEAHRYLYTRQDEWRDLPPEAFPAYVLDMARNLELDLERFTRDISDPEIQALAYRAWQVGRALGMDAAPVVFINGEWFPGPPTFAGLRTVVALAALEQRRFTQCPPWQLEPETTYTLLLDLEQGRVALALEPEWAPLGVNAVVFLARQGWYRGMGLYRVEPQRAVYLGDPSNTGYGHPGFLIPQETPDVPLAPGTVVLMPESPGWNSPRLIVLLGDPEPWQARVTPVGRVVQGLAVLQALPAVDPDRDAPLPLRAWELRATPAAKGSDG